MVRPLRLFALTDSQGVQYVFVYFSAIAMRLGWENVVIYCTGVRVGFRSVWGATKSTEHADA